MAIGIRFTANMVRIVVEVGSTRRTQAEAGFSTQYVGVVCGLDHLKCRRQGVNQIRVGPDRQLERFGHVNSYGDRFQTSPAELGDVGVEFDFHIERRELRKCFSDNVDLVDGPIAVIEQFHWWCQPEVDRKSPSWGSDEFSNIQTHILKRTATSAVRLPSFTSWTRMILAPPRMAAVFAAIVPSNRSVAGRSRSWPRNDLRESPTKTG